MFENTRIFEVKSEDEARSTLIRHWFDCVSVPKPPPEAQFGSTLHFAFQAYGMFFTRVQLRVNSGDLTTQQAVELLAIMSAMFSQLDYTKTVTELVEMLWPTPNYRGMKFVHPGNGFDSPGQAKG